MDSSTHNEPAQETKSTGEERIVAPEFNSWPMEDSKVAAANDTRRDFDAILGKISSRFPPGNQRYLSIVKTKLEEACMFAVKGIAKPTH